MYDSVFDDNEIGTVTIAYQRRRALYNWHCFDIVTELQIAIHLIRKLFLIL